MSNYLGLSILSRVANWGNVKHINKCNHLYATHDALGLFISSSIRSEWNRINEQDSFVCYGCDKKSCNRHKKDCSQIGI